ncbi:MAG: hypothetical protein HOM11_03225 [Methylococcales bacterium]|jgi:hypothetical protein|nr:hypothetical protein [Methylococcales bacterium]MBT7443114.1 hypothetical protein [Methylococcales bacterium]
MAGNVDADALIAKQQTLIKLAKEGISEYVLTNEKAAPILNEVTAQAESMTKLSLEEIEEQWHDYGALHAKGLKPEAFDHFGPEISFMDAIIHPATGIIALNEYKKDKDAEHLEQVKEELNEVLEHLKHIK